MPVQKDPYICYTCPIMCNQVPPITFVKTLGSVKKAPAKCPITKKLGIPDLTVKQVIEHSKFKKLKQVR